MADRIAGRLDPPPPPPEPVIERDESGRRTQASYLMEQDEVETMSVDADGGASLAFNTTWPGSDIEMTLTSPSGKTYDRSSSEQGLFHHNGPTFETYIIQRPESGTWNVRLRGAEVDPGGELTELHVFEEAQPKRLPTATMSASQADSRTVKLSAAGSSDSDGEIAEYLWEFGDGTVAKGREVTHRYSEDGDYRITLAVKDDDGGFGFATADTVTHVTIPKYVFGGFLAPVDSQPTVNVVQAGRAVPTKFSLGGDYGLDIFEAGFPRVERFDCASGASVDEIEETVTAGASALKFDTVSQRYEYVWKTDPAFAGSCRRLVLGFNDGSRHVADFRFR